MGVGPLVGVGPDVAVGLWSEDADTVGGKEIDSWPKGVGVGPPPQAAEATAKAIKIVARALFRVIIGHRRILGLSFDTEIRDMEIRERNTAKVHAEDLCPAAEARFEGPDTRC